MKKILLLLIVSLIIGGCNYNQGIKTDLTKKITIRNKGLSYGDFFFTVDNNKISNNEVKMGSMVMLNVSGINGFKVINDKIKIGASLQLTTMDNTILYNEEDILKNKSEYHKEDGNIMYVSIRIDPPMEVGKEYRWYSRFWDKNQENCEIRVDATIKVKE